MTRVSHDLVSVYVFRRRDRGPEFLLLLRAPDRYMGGTWQPVSGGVEAGETAWQAALRELREETGLVPDRFYQANTVESFYVARTDTVYHAPAFAAEVSGDAEVRLNDEHTDLEWIPVGEFSGRLLWPGQRRVFAEIVQEIINGGPARPYLEIPMQATGQRGNPS